MITGATESIGLAVTRELALRGFKIIILARKQDKLNTLQEHLQDAMVQCKTVQVDLNMVDLSRELIAKSRY